MGWFPIGPDFVFAPRRSDFKRLSRRNEQGRQGTVNSITIEAGDPKTIYVCVRPLHGGSSLFRTRDGGESWVAISDGLRALTPNADPNCVAIHPVDPSIIYVGSFTNGAVHVSNNRGAPGSWTGPHPVEGANAVLKLVVDPRNATNPSTTVLYAALRQKGIYRSANGGTTWTRVREADPTSFVAHIPPTGTAHFYVGSARQGIWHATNPAGPWQNLCDLNIGLPRIDQLGEVRPLVDFCPRAPECVYAWFAMANQTIGLYRTSSSTTSWTQVAAINIPNPNTNFYCYQFAIAPNSPGDGSNDILLFGNINLNRSINGGRNWTTQFSDGFHEDIQSFAFDPPVPAGNVVPTTYLGCDGGLASSLKFADRSVAAVDGLTDFNQGTTYSADLAGWSNLSHGMANMAIMAYACDPRIAAVSVIGCQDTGLAVGERSLGWRGLANADVHRVAAIRGAQGVSCWINWGKLNDWPPFRLFRFSDRRIDSANTPRTQISFGGVSGVLTTANFAVGLDSKVITGMVVRVGSRTTTAVIPVGEQTVTPSTMTGIGVGSRIVVEPGVVLPNGVPNQETVTVKAITGATFTATFIKSHPVGSTLILERAFVGRAGEDDLAQQISQEFGDRGRQVYLAIVDTTNANVLYCVTNDSAFVSTEPDRVWTTNAATSAGPNTVWTEIALNRPRPGSTKLSWIAVDAAGTAYALWQRPIPASSSPGAITTPLYRLSGGGWFAEPLTNIPTTQLGKFVADPLRPNVLYVASGNKVFRLEKSGTTWIFTDIGAGLPGAPLRDLWIANIGTTASPKVLLRAAIATRGVFESDVTPGASDPPIALYVRDHLLDQGWLNPAPEGMANPYNPSETLRHDMCADVKVDTRTEGFFQTDPEGTSPLSHVYFDMLRDKSQSLRQGGPAKVHVMVHNRSRTPATTVQAWAIFCRASGGVPALNVRASGGTFEFWNQFRVDGLIEPGLPADSPWKSVGPPVMLLEMDASRPRVATFDWTIPSLTAGDTGQYCIVVFVHSDRSLINNELASMSADQRMNVDFITPRHRQIGQKSIRVI